MRRSYCGQSGRRQDRSLKTFLTRTDDFLHPPTWLVRRELFKAAGWLDEKHRTMEHYDMALRLAALTPWTFLAGGPVARGRFSKDGKWYSNIINGTNEERLPRYYRTALTRLPATPEADQIGKSPGLRTRYHRGTAVVDRGVASTRHIFSPPYSRALGSFERTRGSSLARASGRRNRRCSGPS